MARLYTEGFENNSYGKLVASSTSLHPVQTTVKRSGSYALELQNSVATTVLAVASATEFYVRFGFYYQIGTGTRRLFSFKSGATVQVSLEFDNATGQFRAYTGAGTTLLFTGGAMAVNTWYLVEMRAKIADSGGAVEVKIDGVSVGSFSGDTKPSTATGATSLGFDTDSASGAGKMFVDDFAVNDTTTATDNAWAGDGKIIALFPNADGDSSQWVGSDGNSTNNYLLVDDTADDTDYVESSASGNKDLYNLSATGLTGVTVSRVWVEARAKSTTTATTMKLIHKSGGTQVSSTQNVGTSFAVVRGADALLDPAGAAWTATTLDALQAGVEVV